MEGLIQGVRFLGAFMVWLPLIRVQAQAAMGAGDSLAVKEQSARALPPCGTCRETPGTGSPFRAKACLKPDPASATLVWRGGALCPLPEPARDFRSPAKVAAARARLAPVFPNGPLGIAPRDLRAAAGALAKIRQSTTLLGKSAGIFAKPGNSSGHACPPSWEAKHGKACQRHQAHRAHRP